MSNTPASYLDFLITTKRGGQRRPLYVDKRDDFNKVLGQGYVRERLRSSLKEFYGR